MFKKIKLSIWSKIEKKAISELSDKIKELENSINETISRKKLEYELHLKEMEEINKKRSFYEKEYQELKLVYETKANELRQQIKILEAKASPDQVWVSAFTAGVSKTFELMSDVHLLAHDETIKNLIKQTENKTMGAVDEIVKKRINNLEDKQLRDKQEMVDKIKEFELKKLEAQRLGKDKEVVKYADYLILLNWVVYDKKAV